MLEVLHRALMSFGGFPGSERAKVAATSGLRILFARVKTVFA
jgi:hypothetical protein